MKANVGGIDRTVRIVAGLVLIGLAATGTVGWWGWLGAVPLATGLLPVCFGEATKLAGNLLGSRKAYDTVARLGGDEFVVMLEDLGTVEIHAAGQAEREGRRSGAQVNAASAMTASNIVMQRAAFAQSNARQVTLGRLGRLADRLGNLTGLAVSVTDAALLVADDDECCETETTAALDDLRDAVDGNQLVDDFGLFAIFAAFATTTTATSNTRVKDMRSRFAAAFAFFASSSPKSSASLSVIAPPSCSASTIVTARRYQRVTS